jgi:hypothetical protein
MQTPTCLYHRDGSVITVDAAEVSDYLAQGYADTPAAFEGLESEVVDEVPADDAPVTRAELEAKATDLGLTFDGRTTDAKLASASPKP